MGLPVWELGRRAKIRSRVGQAITRLKEKFDMPTTAVMYAALAHAERQGVDLRAIVVEDFGQAPKRALPWHLRAQRSREEKNRANEVDEAERTGLQDGAGAG